MEIIFLGTGAGNGVPAFYCSCEICEEAHGDSKYRRTRCAIAVKGITNILVDAPPEISTQLIRENIGSVDWLFLTHAHNDHTAGLGDLEIYARFFMGKRLPAFMSKETLAELKIRHSSIHDWLDVTLVETGQSVEVNGLTVTAVSAAHAQGTFGYVLESEGVCTAYIPDTGPLPPDTKARLQGIERLILDATFNGDNWYPSEHQSIASAIKEAQALDVEQLYLTHLSMHYSTPVTSADIERLVKPYNEKVKLAYDGMRLDMTQKSLVSSG